MERAKVVGFISTSTKTNPKKRRTPQIQKKRYVPRPMTYQPFKEALKVLVKDE